MRLDWHVKLPRPHRRNMFDGGLTARGLVYKGSIMVCGLSMGDGHGMTPKWNIFGIPRRSGTSFFAKSNRQTLRVWWNPPQTSPRNTVLLFFFRRNPCWMWGMDPIETTCGTQTRRSDEDPVIGGSFHDSLIHSPSQPYQQDSTGLLTKH